MDIQTLSDALAETLSINYSNYTLERYGAVLHHNFDKVGLLGGASNIIFGAGHLTKPICVLLNGRASTKFGDDEIPIKDLLILWSKNFLQSRFPTINPDRDLEFHYNLSNQSSPGKTEDVKSSKGTRKNWFEPRNLNDLQELKRLVSNDTSVGVGYAPYSILEELVLKIENTLNSGTYQKDNPWIGSDIKLMGFRSGKEFSITMCIPQIADYVFSAEEYKANLDKVRTTVYGITKTFGIENLELNLNTRDNFDTMELYLTVIGSSIESGDEGLVGRGNRINGVISPLKPMSMEGACGKNPVYHIGKIYYLAANELAKKIFKKFGVANEVYLISQSGRDLIDPWKVDIQVENGFTKHDELRCFVESEIKKIPELTKGILNGEYTLY